MFNCDRFGRRHRSDRDDAVSKYRQQHRGFCQAGCSAVWVGADQKIGDLLSGPGFPTTRPKKNAVRASCIWCNTAKVVATLAQVPPAMPSVVSYPTSMAARADR